MNETSILLNSEAQFLEQIKSIDSTNRHEYLTIGKLKMDKVLEEIQQVPLVCKENCCTIHKMTASIGDKQILVPLKAVMIKSELRGCLSTTVFELSYVNPMSEVPLECSYTFPVDPNSVMCDFEATIGDRKMVTKIQEKEAALEKYDDAIA